MYRNDNRIVATLDAGGTNLVFSAMRGYENIIEPITLPSRAHDLDECLAQMVAGFTRVLDSLEEKPVAISFAFPGPADYPNGIIGGYLPNFPSFRDGVALGAFLEEKFSLPVFINNDGDLFAYGEAVSGALHDVNERIAALGGKKRYRNLVGFTFGTGLGIGTVINGQLNLGDNSCVETWILRSKLHPDLFAEEECSIRAIVREYNRLSGALSCRDGEPGPDPTLTPYDIFRIAEGTKPGNAEAARQAFALMGEVAGDVFATAAVLFDAIIVVGGGPTGAMKYIRPALLKEMRSDLHTFSGEAVKRVPMEVFNLDDEEEFARFALGSARELKVPGSDRTVIYDPMKRTGLTVSRLGASQAISIGAYSYALSRIDNVNDK